MSDQSNHDYEVGYAKPPKSSQFKKGQSGNPKGRPKEAKGMKASLKRELASKITVRERGREIKISKAEALAKGMMGDAIKGDAKSRIEILKLDDEFFGDNQTSLTGHTQSAAPEPVDLDILRDFFATDGDSSAHIEEETEDDGT